MKDLPKLMFEATLPFHLAHSHPLKSVGTAMLLALVLWLATPFEQLFPENYSHLVFDTNGQLLRATLAQDEQYRFLPDTTALSPKYVTALLQYEDKRFYSHPGVDPLALAQAFISNVTSDKRIRGGSTITMQVARLARPKPRTYFNKLLECLTAIKLTCHFSKTEILQLYAAHVPMGGNLVGIQAASYCYFGKPMQELTWAQAALFAILPNSPTMINLERQRPNLRKKRNQLLASLAEEGIIDELSARLANTEPLPEKGQKLPFTAPHFTEFALTQESNQTRLSTTLDKKLQERIALAADLHHASLAEDGVQNLAVLVVETQTRKIRAYVGSHDFYDDLHGGQVDGVQALRSTGSLLKPFLVAKALERGPYTLATKIQDVPTYFGTFTPQNASKSFLGLASIKQVLIRSLNVPAVRLLNAYGLNDFYDFLKDAELKGLFRSPEGYGLSLILGGAEASLFEMTQLYATLGNLGAFQPLTFFENTTSKKVPAKERPLPDFSENDSGKRILSEGSSWLVSNTLRNLARPGSDYYWRYFDNQIPVAWKTGTSYGQKDAWAVGVNRQWTVGVWVGNFTGEGNAELSGAESAAPLMFDIFNSISDWEAEHWFEEPEHDLKSVECCAQSGYPAGPYCPEKIYLKVPFSAYRPGTCRYHKRYLLAAETGLSTCSLCWAGLETRWETRYIMPPIVKNILAQNGFESDAIPRHLAHCPNSQDRDRLQLLYPVAGIKIFVPRDFDGKYEEVVFSAKHQQPDMSLFWYLNDHFIRETSGRHEFSYPLPPGDYTLKVEDEDGVRKSVSFSAFRKKGELASR